MNGLREDADQIIKTSIEAVLPDEAVRKALQEKFPPGRKGRAGALYVIAVGKAAWQMANAAYGYLGDKIRKGIVITKYGHVQGKIPKMICYEAGHPVPDENSFAATRAAVSLAEDLGMEDQVLFLLSGGGSALFEEPLISLAELQDITQQLLSCGADIVEINTIRKRLSAVKGGKFAKICAPARVYSIVLSDILEDPLDMIASGPVWPDSSTCAQAVGITEKYGLILSKKAGEYIRQETPKVLDNVESHIMGSVRALCAAAAGVCEKLGYRPLILTDQLTCEAREAGSFLAAIARSHCNTGEDLAFIAGGETVVHLTGRGKGGRNQELALGAAEGIAGLDNVAIFSVGSDGTDGPTDAAGGFCDGKTKERLTGYGIDIHDVLRQNDAYPALKRCEGLVVTGPTGTNVNDVAVLLIRGKRSDKKDNKS